MFRIVQEYFKTSNTEFHIFSKPKENTEGSSHRPDYRYNWWRTYQRTNFKRLQNNISTSVYKSGKKSITPRGVSTQQSVK